MRVCILMSADKRLLHCYAFKQ